MSMKKGLIPEEDVFSEDNAARFGDEFNSDLLEEVTLDPYSALIDPYEI